MAKNKVATKQMAIRGKRRIFTESVKFGSPLGRKANRIHGGDFEGAFDEFLAFDGGEGEGHTRIQLKVGGSQSPIHLHDGEACKQWVCINDDGLFRAANDAGQFISRVLLDEGHDIIKLIPWQSA